ncbi:MAG: heat-inducible transcription repressor HrcA, partial [Firmicutes bacterium]|nr:heat-inducible transcription repressor HrcA [Bacillota bacterium]
ISFAVTPSHRENKLKYVRFLSVDERTVVLMIVAEDGKVTNQAIRVNSPYSEENLELMSKVATVNFEGRPINDILTADIIENFRNDLAAISALASSVVPSFIRTLERMLDVDLFMEGYSNIFSLPEFNDISRARSFLSLMDRREEITDALVKRGNGLIITIGGENSEDMKDCSVITADYRVNGKLIGKLGVIGPTRMKYGEISSVIKYMTDNLNDTFSLGGDTDDE